MSTFWTCVFSEPCDKGQQRAAVLVAPRASRLPPYLRQHRGPPPPSICHATFPPAPSRTSITMLLWQYARFRGVVPYSLRSSHDEELSIQLQTETSKIGCFSRTLDQCCHTRDYSVRKTRYQPKTVSTLTMGSYRMPEIIVLFRWLTFAHSRSSQHFRSST